MNRRSLCSKAYHELQKQAAEGHTFVLYRSVGLRSLRNGQIRRAWHTHARPAQESEVAGQVKVEDISLMTPPEAVVKLSQFPCMFVARQALEGMKHQGALFLANHHLERFRHTVLTIADVEVDACDLVGCILLDEFL